MELSEALAQITQIREHILRTEVFRGCRSLTVGFSGVLALLAAAIQSRYIGQPAEHLGTYLALWIGTAAVSVAVVGLEIWFRTCSARSMVARELTGLAIEQFLPCLVAGGAVTAVIVRRAADSAWMLPGLWAVIFSLGIFAAHRLLPRALFIVGMFYLVCGIGTLALGPGGGSLSPWTMGVTFGGGQLLAAAIFYFTLERNERERSS